MMTTKLTGRGFKENKTKALRELVGKAKLTWIFVVLRNGVMSSDGDRRYFEHFKGF